MGNWANKESLFKLPVPREKHTIEGTGDIWVHGLMCGQKDDYENKVFQIKAGTREVRLTNARAMLLVETVYDQHGKRMFGDNDVGRICQMPASIVDPIYDKARRLSGMLVGDIEQLVKNSEIAQSEDSDLD